MEHQNWKCSKCENRRFEVDEFTAPGRGLSKFFNVQNRGFTTVTCTDCQYTEIYRTPTSHLSNVLDFFGN